MSKMPSAEEVERVATFLNSEAFDYGDKAALILRQFATLLRQTTEGTESGEWPTPEHAQHIQFEGCDCVVMSPESYEGLYNLCRAYEQRLKMVEAENARLRAAMDKYSEDEMLLRCKTVEIVNDQIRQAFDRWLRSVCFQAPTKEAYDLAWEAWQAAVSEKPAQPKEPSDG